MNPVIEIPLACGRIAMLDMADYQLIRSYAWHSNSRKDRSYVSACVKKDDGKYTTKYLHRILLDAPAGSVVDHINGDGLDNRRSNLRVCSQSDNTRNSRARANNTSGYKGVSWNTALSKWVMQCIVDGTNKYQGLYTDKHEAAEAYNALAKREYGDFAFLNEIKRDDT